MVLEKIQIWIIDKEYLKPGLAEWMCTYVFAQGSTLIKAPCLSQCSVIAVLEFLIILSKKLIFSFYTGQLF